VEYAYIHTWMAYLLFHNFCFPQRHLVAPVAFRAEVPPFLCSSSGSLDSLLYHLAWKADSHMIFINHCRVSFHRSLELLMPRKLNSWLLLFLDFGARFLNEFCFSSLAVHENPPLAIFAIFKARRMSDCSSCT